MGGNKKNGDNRRYTLSKEERLSWKRYIDLLFAKGQSFVAFPLRVVYLAVEEEITSSSASYLGECSQKKIQACRKTESDQTSGIVKPIGFANMI